MSLRAAAGLYAVGLVLHTADHYRRGIDAITPQVETLGTIGLVLGVVTIVLVFMGHARAPLAAALVGLPKAIGVTLVHTVAAFGVYSDAFPGNDAAVISWIAVTVEVAGAAALGIIGLRQVMRSATTA